jgi:hypothetical protein
MAYKRKNTKLSRNEKLHSAFKLAKKLKSFLSLVPGGGAELASSITELMSEASLQDGTQVRIDDTTLEVSVIDADGNVTGLLADGSYTLADGSTLEVKDGLVAADPETLEDPKPDDEEKKKEEEELKAKVATLSAQLKTKEDEGKALSEQVAKLAKEVEKLSAQPAADPVEKNPQIKLSAAQARLNDLRNR